MLHDDHELFAADPYCTRWLAGVRGGMASAFTCEPAVERMPDDLADRLEAALVVDVTLADTRG